MIHSACSQYQNLSPHITEAFQALLGCFKESADLRDIMLLSHNCFVTQKWPKKIHVKKPRIKGGLTMQAH